LGLGIKKAWFAQPIPCRTRLESTLDESAQPGFQELHSYAEPFIVAECHYVAQQSCGEQALDAVERAVSVIGRENFLVGPSVASHITLSSA
jgi:hypothetical protein